MVLYPGNLCQVQCHKDIPLYFLLSAYGYISYASVCDPFGIMLGDGGWEGQLHLFCMRISRFSTTISWTGCPFELELSWHSCQKSFSHIYLSLFLCSLVFHCCCWKPINLKLKCDNSENCSFPLFYALFLLKYNLHRVLY